MLISISKVLETPVSTLLGETVAETGTSGLEEISERLEAVNLYLAHRKAARRTALHWFFILLCAGTAAVFAALMKLGSPYLNWDLSQPETAVMEVAFHAFEWLFVRIAPFVLAGSIAGVCLTRKKA